MYTIQRVRVHVNLRLLRRLQSAQRFSDEEVGYYKLEVELSALQITLTQKDKVTVIWKLQALSLQSKYVFNSDSSDNKGHWSKMKSTKFLSHVCYNNDRKIGTRKTWTNNFEIVFASVLLEHRVIAFNEYVLARMRAFVR